MSIKTYWITVRVIHERGYKIEATNEDEAKLKAMDLDDSYDAMGQSVFEFEHLINKKIDHTFLD